MARHTLSAAFSPAFLRLFHDLPIRHARRVRPCLEALEERITPTTFTPTTFADDGTMNALRGALTQANGDPGTATDTIQLAAGTYQLTIANSSGKHEQANAQGDLNITSTAHALVIQGATDARGNPATTIQQTVLDRVFQIVNPGISVTFKDVIIAGGLAEEEGGAGTPAGSTEAEGGGILDDGGSVTLTHVVLQNNSADAGTHFSAAGGGIYAGNGGSLTIQSSTIKLDSAFGGDGGISVTDDNGGEAEGGGIFADGLTSITNSSLSDNVVAGGNASTGHGSGGSAHGGGIYTDGPTTITDSTLAGNTLTGGSSSGGDGGGAFGGGIYTDGPTTITDSTLAGNTLTGGSSSSGGDGGNVIGGGVDLDVVSTATITASTLSGNTLTGGSSGSAIGGSAIGGGVFSFESTATITASTLSGNTLTGGNCNLSNSIDHIGDGSGHAAGGGVYSSDGTMTISASTLSGNTLIGGNGTYSSGTVDGSIGGGAFGGGVYSTGTAIITASTLSGNILTGGNGSGGSDSPGLAQGGGAYFAVTGNTLVNSTVADNQAMGGQGAPGNPVASGGGLFFGGTATATLTNVTVAGNKASLPQGGEGSTSGGGIDNTDTAAQAVTLTNTLVALNSATTGPDYKGAVGTGSGHNLIGNADGSSGFGSTRGDLLGSTAAPLAPKLGPLAQNGGPTQTLALLSGSPALQAGDNSIQAVTGPFDQRGQGFARVANGAADIGAFEVQPPPPSPPPPPVSPLPSPPPPKLPTTLHTPPLLALFDALLKGIETVNSNETEAVIDSFFGLPLLVSIYDASGDLTSVTLFGVNVTSLFELSL